MLSRDEWIAVDLIWTMEIEYAGSTYRFSTIPIDLDQDGDYYPFTGGLEDLSIETSMERVGDISAESNSVSIAVIFPNRNISKDVMAGKILENSQVKLGFVLSRNGEITTNYDDIAVIFKGRVSSPVYGHPEEPLGYVEFSVDNPALISEQGLLASIIGENMYVEDISCSNALYVNPEWPQDQGLTEVQDIHRGKTIPWVFGDLAALRRSNNTSISIPISPCYAIAYDPSAGHKPVFYVIAGHETNASTVKAFSNTGEEEDGRPVSMFINIDGRALSYIDLSSGSTIPQSVAPNDDRQVWIEFDDGDPFPNPLGGDDGLRGGGDICLWLLQQITTDIDYDAWNALRPYLNQYQFAGYVNDPKITIIQWLHKNIIAYLPISVVNGGNGLKPVLDMFVTEISTGERLNIITGPEWFRMTPVSTQTNPEEITNNVMVRYGKNGVTDTYSVFVQCGHTIPAGGTLSSQSYLASPKSLLSVQRYGVKSRVVELDYVYSMETAQRIALDIIERDSIPIRTITYSVSPRYGYLMIGDIVTLSDEDIGLVDTRTQILSKIWSNNRWEITLRLDDNPLRYERNVET